MQKTHLYIVQILGIIVLLCGFLLKNKPDHLSVMHFDVDPAHQMVMSKSHKSASQHKNIADKKSLSKNDCNHKTKEPKHISFDVVLETPQFVYPTIVQVVKHSTPLPENYVYLFYEEINPPPPRTV